MIFILFNKTKTMRDTNNETRDREYSPAEKMFVVDLKLKGMKYDTIKTMFLAKFNKVPPTRQGLHYLTMKLKKSSQSWTKERAGLVEE